MVSPRRRGGGKARTPRKSPAREVVEEISDNDDAAEMARNRRRKREITAAASPFKSPHASSGGLNRATRKTQLTDEGIADLYANCIKLSADNKISQKNTWNLNLIDHMDEMVTHAMSVTSEGGTNFTVASGTIEAGVKIYSSRVDSVHTEVYKVLGNLSRANDRGDGTADHEAEHEHEEEEGDQATGKPKRKLRSGGATLEANAEALNLKELEYQVSADPLFQKTSASFDEGGAKGMLLNHLAVQSGCQIVFDSSDAVTDDTCVEEESDDNLDMDSLGDVAVDLQKLVSSIGSTMLTPGFTSFRCSRSEGRSAEPPSLVVDTSFQAGASYNDQDIDDDDDDFYGGDDLDDDGGDAMESDGDPTRFHSMGADAATGAGAEPLDFPMEFLKSATGGTDLAYLDQAIFGCNWSGPGGTFKNSKSQKPDATKEKQPKEKFLLDFTRPVPASALAGGEAKETYTLSQGAIDNASEASTTMPEDHHYQLRDLLVLFSKPLIAPRSGRASQDVVDSTSDAGWYDYANDNDAENFCPDMGDDDDDDDDCPTESSMLDEDIGLVGVPQLVGKVPINYARAAKKVDVQVLKESIWNTIDADASCKAGKTKQSAAQEQSPKTFQSVMSGVSSHVPLAKKEMMKDVSVPFCFICLLHLANEKNLVLTDDKLGALNRLDITEDGLGKVASGSCDWKTASGQLTEITNRAAVEA